MPSSSHTLPSLNHLKGWLLDVYPTNEGEVAVWIISETGERIRLVDSFQPKIYISAEQDEIERLASRLYKNQNELSAWAFAEKYAQPTDQQKTRVLEITLKDYRKIPRFTREILRLGEYSKYEIHNCDLHADRAYFFSKDLFPLARVEVINGRKDLCYELQDSTESNDYAVPSFRIMNLQVEIAKEGKIASFKDPISKIILKQDDEQVDIDSGDETDKLLKLVDNVTKLDPDFLLTHGGDSYLFPYLIQRATLNGVLSQLILSRDPVPFPSKTPTGRTFFSYGRTFYKAGTQRLYGRIHVDRANTFVLSEADFDGLFEIARTCRVPLHTAARNSIGSSMSSLQFYQAIKDDVLIPRNKSIPEAFKTAYELLVGDRGGFVFEPRVGAHDYVGEVDFSSMYPSLMANNNISAETVLCKCCPDSTRRIPELNYHICTNRTGIVPKTLSLIVAKRRDYKKMKDEASDPYLRKVYDNRQIALKWILVTCFGYLGYKNAKFGTVDGHIGVCAFGRDAILKAANTAESRGFEVIHGIVDSLWLKKQDATIEEYQNLCEIITQQSGVSISFEGRYKWIVFMPSKMHPRIGVLNRYYGVMENGKVKVRGIEVRRRDTPRFVYNAQMEMLNVFASANNAVQLRQKIPEALEVVKSYRHKLIDGDVSLWDLIVTKHLSKRPDRYKQHVSQVIAAEQLMKLGAEVHAGNNIGFLFTHVEHRRHERRVKAEQLIEEGVNPDTKKYLFLLYASAANMLSFAGYTTTSVHDAINGHYQKDLLSYSL
jgi:DNA polymerase elongation subunit (family B)